MRKQHRNSKRQNFCSHEMEQSSSQASSQRVGIVLIIVLVIVFMLSFAGFSFVNSLFIENKAAHLRQEEIQVSMTLNSGVEAIKALVQYSPDRQEDFGGLYNNPEIFRGRKLFAEDLDETSTKYNTGRFTVISPRMEEEKIIGIRFGLVNESSKLNLSTLNKWEKKEAGSGVQALMKLPGMTETIANSIMDWIDEDSIMREGGAENDYYEGIEPGYTARNALPESMEELLLIKGMTRLLLYGIDQNYNYLHEEFEKEVQKKQATSNLDEEGFPWIYYLTIYSAEKNLNSKGKKYLNINSADLSKLYTGLKKLTDEKLAKFIIAYRLYGPYQGSEKVNNSYSGNLDFKLKPMHQFKTLLDLIDVKVGIPIKDNKIHVLKSPLDNNLEQLKKLLPDLSEKLTTESRSVIPGMININQASAIILAGIPEISEALVTQILSSRTQENSDEGILKNNPLWIFFEGLVDLETMKKILPHITAGGDVYRAQIVGFYDNAGPSTRGEVIIDATKSPPQRIYWRNLQMLGKGFPPDILGVVPDELLEVN